MSNIVYTLLFFCAFAVVNFIAFIIYARALLFLAGFNRFIKVLGGMLTYFCFAFYLISPFWLLSLLGFNAPAKDLHLAMFLLFYILSIVPAGFYFKKCYLERLKSYGYFKK